MAGAAKREANETTPLALAQVREYVSMKKSPLSTTKSQSKSPAKKSQPRRKSKLSKAKAQMLPVNMFCLHQ